MKITKDNLASEYENYKQYLKDAEMRSNVKDAIEISEFYGENEDITKAVDAIAEMVNIWIEKNKKPEKTPTDDKTKRLRLAKAKAKAARGRLKLMTINGIGDVTTAKRRKNAGATQCSLFDDVRERFDKHWDAERGEYVYTDFDGDLWHKNKQGHFCLLNGRDDFEIRWDVYLKLGSYIPLDEDCDLWNEYDDAEQSLIDELKLDELELDRMLIDEYAHCYKFLVK